MRQQLSYAHPKPTKRPRAGFSPWGTPDRTRHDSGCGSGSDGRCWINPGSVPGGAHLSPPHPARKMRGGRREDRGVASSTRETTAPHRRASAWCSCSYNQPALQPPREMAKKGLVVGCTEGAASCRATLLAFKFSEVPYSTKHH
jgi:hypothetical protein